MIWMLIIVAVLFLVMGCFVGVYLSPRRCVASEAKESESASGELLREELIFKLDMLMRTGKSEVWDYSLAKDRFCYLRVNDASVSPFEGFTLDQYLACVMPSDRHVISESVDQMCNQAIDRREDTFRIQTPGASEYRWVDAIVMVTKRDEKGYPVVMSGCWWDVTEQIGHTHQLQQDKTLLEMAMRASSLVPWSFDLKGASVSSDNRLSQFYQQKFPIHDYIENLVHPDHQEQFRDLVDQIVLREIHEVDFKTKVRYDEEYEWVHIVGKVVNEPTDSQIKVVGTRSVITKEVAREEELEALRREAEEASCQKSIFLANMGHEIRTPLNAIVGFSGLLTQELGSEESREYCHIIETNTELLMQLVGDILDMAKIEAGQLEFNYTELELCRLLTDLKQTYNLKVPESVEVVCDFPDEVYLFYTERNRLTQVVANLLNNAVKYTQKGSITVGYRHVESGIRVFVRDTGRGIAAENLSDVFVRFTKFDSTVAGTGLGLSICKTIVERLGGKIGVESQEGKGSEFWFTLPEIRPLV